MKTPSADFNENILQTIGNTPLVRINKFNPNKNSTMHAKVEEKVNSDLGKAEKGLLQKMREVDDKSGLIEHVKLEKAIDALAGP